MKAPLRGCWLGNNDRHPTERADLFQKRFVFALRPSKACAWLQVFVKESTGGDPITARRMRKISDVPAHTQALSRDESQTRDQRHGQCHSGAHVAHSLHVTIPAKERDTTLPEKLQGSWQVLAWAVRGCLSWQKEGLGELAESD